jgi:hypothetical protein
MEFYLTIKINIQDVLKQFNDRKKDLEQTNEYKLS